MENQKNDVFVGWGKQVHPNINNISLCLTDAEQHVYEYNGKKYLRLSLIQKKETDQYGKTHFLKINDYNPNNANNQNQPKQEPVSAGTGLPF